MLDQTSMGERSPNLSPISHRGRCFMSCHFPSRALVTWRRDPTVMWTHCAVHTIGVDLSSQVPRVLHAKIKMSHELVILVPVVAHMVGSISSLKVPLDRFVRTDPLPVLLIWWSAQDVDRWGSSFLAPRDRSVKTDIQKGDDGSIWPMKILLPR